MALLNDELSIWEISFRWAGHDPDRRWLQLPLDVKDWFRVLMGAVLQGELPCISLLLEKWHPDSDMPPEFYIRSYIDEVYECIGGKRFNRKLLRWAVVERWALREWCERRTIPLPAFWFPEGWSYGYQWPEEETENGESAQPPDGDAEEPSEERLRNNQRARIAVQQIAINLWKQDPNHTIAGLVEHPSIQQLSGASSYTPEVVRRWISAVAPKSVKEKRGRPKKKTPPEA